MRPGTGAAQLLVRHARAATAAGALLLLVAAASVPLAPARLWERPAAPVERVLGCGDAAAASARAQAGAPQRGPEEPAEVVTVRSDRLLLRVSSGEAPFELACEGERLRVASSVVFDTGGAPMAFPAGSNVRLVLRSDGSADVAQVCLGCSFEPERPAPVGVMITALALLGALLGAAPFLLALLRRDHARAWLRGRQAPSATEPAHAPPGTEALTFAPARGGDAFSVSGRLVGMRAGAPAALDEPDGPHLRLAGVTGAPFRAGPGGWHALVGPGRVNGLRVAAGASAAIAEGDVVRLGRSRPLRIVRLGGGELPMRYRLIAPGMYRVGVAARAGRALWLALAPLPLVGAAILLLGAPSADRVALARAAWAPALAFLFGAVRTAPLWALPRGAGRLRCIDGGRAVLELGADPAVELASIERRADAVVGVTPSGAELVLEAASPGPLGSSEDRALDAALEAELDRIAAAVAEAGGRSSAP